MLAGLLALACLAMGLGLASQHPLGALPALLGVVAVAGMARYFWIVWPGWMLALVPLLALAPWSGWLWLEELDLLVLASAAGGYAALSGPHRHRPPAPLPPWRRELQWGAGTKLLLLLWALSALLALFLGVQDAGGWVFDAFDGVHEPGYALRGGKTILHLLLLAPLWVRSTRRASAALTPSLLLGLGGVLVVASLGALLELQAYVGLTALTSAYRASSVFWEAHLGGRPLEGVLALTLPFGLLLLTRQRSPRAFGVALLLMAVAGYAVLAAFSAPLYLACLLGLGLTSLLLWLQRRRARREGRDPASSWFPGKVPTDADLRAQSNRWPGRGGLLLLVAIGAVAAWQLYPSSAERGLLALLGAWLALVAQPPGPAQATTAQRITSWLMGAVAAAPLIGLSALLALGVDKSAYGTYVLAWLCSMGLARSAWGGRHPWRTPMGDALRAAAWLWNLGSVAVVAWTWGGSAALEATLLPLGVLACIWPLAQGGSLGQLLATLDWRARVGSMGLLAVTAAILAALSGGAYLSERLGAGSPDGLGPRMEHWGRVLTLLEGHQGWWVGMGSGRFAAKLQADAPEGERSGDYRWLSGPDGARLRLAAGTHEQRAGALLRLSQRIDAAPPRLKLRLQARVLEPTQLQTEVCERHVLLDAACRRMSVELTQTDWQWHNVDVELGGMGELGQSGWLGRSLAFSVAVASKGKRVELRQMSLKGADGVELLRNGDFRREGAHWLVSSEKRHLPWQADNLLLHLMFEQGLLGLLLWLTLLVLTLGRLTLGLAREHPLAPALVGGLVAFLVVGMTASLLNTPRVAFLFYTLLLLGLGLRAPPPAVPAPTPQA